MSAVPHVDSSTNVKSSPRQTAPISAESRLNELKKALQRQLKRKPTLIEKAALNNCALLMLRSEIAARDGKATSEDIVRLANVARRAQQDFARIAAVPTKRTLTLAQVLRDG
jgi:hypothetical protein